MKAVLVFAIAAIAAVSAHVCMIYPEQRGAVWGLDTKGSGACIRLDAECGKMMPEKPNAILTKGANVTIIFQKNLNHWDQATPGSFDVAVGDEKEENFRPLASLMDTNTSSLTIYAPNVTIPMDAKSGAAVLQLKYVTKNPNAPAVFYQCADVMIV